MGDPAPGILVVDDDRIILDSLCEFLRVEGYQVEGAIDADAALRALGRRPLNVVVTDINMPGSDGFELLRIIKQRHPEIVVIIITGYGTIESAVEAIKLGAYDYLTKPIIDDEIRLTVERALKQQALVRENQALRDRLNMRYGLDNIVGHDYKMLRVFDLIEAVADSKATVLIQGDSGTGKSMIARAIHHRSDRRDHPFVEVACGALPDQLLESELFGHVRGAFTGAVVNKEGKFTAADGGSLFLDEVSTATPGLQIKLLRAIQERAFEPVGSNKTETVDVRLILATNVDLEKEVEQGRFRQDLFYRINVVAIPLPPLRERLGDIPLLADAFLAEYCEQARKTISGFTEDAMECLQRYDWPGNVRELENVVERAVVLTKSRQIGIDGLPPKLVEAAQMSRADGVTATVPLKQALEGPEKAVIESALRANGWNRQLTADQLEINRTTLYKKMKRYGLDADPAQSHRTVSAR